MKLKVLAGEQLGAKVRGLGLRRALSGRTGRVDKREPPSQLTSPRSLSVAFQNAGPGLWASGFLRMQVFRRAATWVMPQKLLNQSKLINYTGFAAARVRGDSISP